VRESRRAGHDITFTIRPIAGAVFAAFLALSLIATTVDALADTGVHNGGSAFFDQGNGGSNSFLRPRPIGRLGVTWE
jgi:hypothetical protein